MINEPKLKCPKCKSLLILSGMSRYQNLIEHVSDPNGLASVKEEYRCKNNCYPNRIFWDWFGDVYITPSWIERLLWSMKIYGLISRLEVPDAKKVDETECDCGVGHYPGIHSAHVPSCIHNKKLEEQIKI